MPKGPNGQKRPADAIGLAVMVGRIATGEIKDNGTAGSEAQRELLVEEYKSCRDLIGRNIDIIERTEVYAIGAIAASATFSLAANDRFVAEATCGIPLAISTLGLIRYIGIDSTIHKINNYLSDVENKYPLLGWTKSYRKQNKWKILKATRYIIWGLAVAASIAFAAYTLLNRLHATHPAGRGVSTITGYDRLHGVKVEMRISN